MLSDLENWESVAAEYDRFVTKDFLRRHLLNPALLALIGDVKKKTVLDAGCGNGYCSKLLAERGAKVVGIDGSKKLINIAQKKYGGAGGAITFQVADLTKPLPLRDKQFDLIVANMVLMDLDPIDMAISEFSRLLKSGGRLIFSIIHPLTSAGELGKTTVDKLLRRLPHYQVKQYKGGYKKTRSIVGLSLPTSFYHRSLEFYFQPLKKNNFVVRDLQEPTCDKKTVADKNNFLKLCAEIPPFLLFDVVRL